MSNRCSTYRRCREKLPYVRIYSTHRSAQHDFSSTHKHTHMYNKQTKLFPQPYSFDDTETTLHREGDDYFPICTRSSPPMPFHRFAALDDRRHMPTNFYVNFSLLSSPLAPLAFSLSWPKSSLMSHNGPTLLFLFGTLGWCGRQIVLVRQNVFRTTCMDLRSGDREANPVRKAKN